MDDKALPVFQCVWRDAWFDRDESNPLDWTDQYFVHTVGFLVRDEDTVLSLAGEILPDGQFRSVTHIPRALVVTLKEVRQDWNTEGEGNVRNIPARTGG